MQAFFEKISKISSGGAAAWNCSLLAARGSLGSAMGRRAETLCAAQGAWKEITGQEEERRRAH